MFQGRSQIWAVRFLSITYTLDVDEKKLNEVQWRLYIWTGLAHLKLVLRELSPSSHLRNLRKIIFYNICDISKVIFDIIWLHLTSNWQKYNFQSRDLESGYVINGHTGVDFKMVCIENCPKNDLGPFCPTNYRGYHIRLYHLIIGWHTLESITFIWFNMWNVAF